MAKATRILCIDIGASGLKAAIVAPNGKFLVQRVRVKTPKARTPGKVVPLLLALVKPLGRFDHVTIGFPGMVKTGKVVSAPNMGTEDWADFPLAAVMRKKLGKPVKLLNDADVQGLAVIKGKGLELVCTLGTGFGTAWTLGLGGSRCTCGGGAFCHGALELRCQLIEQLGNRG